MVSAMTADAGVEPLVGHERRQMHAVEGHVEAAHEEAGGQQQVARVREGLLEGFAQRLRLSISAGLVGACRHSGQASGSTMAVVASNISRLAFQPSSSISRCV